PIREVLCLRAALREKRAGDDQVRLRDMQATAAIVLLLISGVAQPGWAQQTGASSAAQQTGPAGAPSTSPTAPAAPVPTGQDQAVPAAPQPKMSEPLYLRPTEHDYT